MPDPEKPKVALATGDPALRERLADLLERTDVDVEAIGKPGDLTDLADGDATVVVLRHRHLTNADLEQIEALAENDDAPAVVVMADEADPQERAELIAAGVTSVIDTDDSAHRIGEALEAVAEAAAESDVGAPETGGAGVEPRLADFLSRSERMRDFLDVVQRVAATNSLLLITGETGVGKEHLARAIHAESPRGDGPFVSVNCGALPENLLESELFGHLAGAFTGARSARVGRFEEAAGGTIFLDEIGELPKHLQVKLLTVLQRHEIRPVGAEKPRRVDVRVMAATNRDLASDVRDGSFREDLYYRLNVVPLVIPPLRERREDLPDLIGMFIRHLRDRLGRDDVDGIEADALDLLLAHDWPGNVRELINVVERAMLLSRGPRLARADLPQLVGGPAEPLAPREPAAAPDAKEEFDLPLAEAKKRTVERFERAYLKRLLEQTQGRVGATAERAGVSARTLYEKMKRYGLRKEDYR